MKRLRNRERRNPTPDARTTADSRVLLPGIAGILREGKKRSPVRAKEADDVHKHLLRLTRHNQAGLTERSALSTKEACIPETRNRESGRRATTFFCPSE